MTILSQKLATIGAIFALALVSGCAGGPKINLAKPGEKIVLTAAETSLNNVDGVSIGNDAVGGDLARGAGGGLLAGAYAGMSCGPWALICSPAMAVSGALVGGTGGVIVGSFRGLDGEEKRAVLASIDGYFQGNQPTDAIIRRVGERLGPTWETVDGPADNELVLSIERIAIDGQGSDQVTLEIRVAVTARNLVKAKEVRRSFAYKSTPAPVGYWLEGDNGFLADQFDAAYGAITEEIYFAMYGG